MSWTWEVPAVGWAVTPGGPELTVEEALNALAELDEVFAPPSPSAA
jgi:hypothetical protein